MSCKHSENCTYYKIYRHKSSRNQSQFIVENYCEGSLHSRCQRRQYLADFNQEPPSELAPNGYIVGTHKKLAADNTRKFKRHRIKNGACLLKTLDEEKTFSADVIDISEGGIKLGLKVHPKQLNICSENNHLKILGYSLEDTPFPLAKGVVKMIWQDNRVIGCSFAAPLPRF